MKPKLIIIGNKPISHDMSFIDSEFDYILRVNRMLNFGNTGYRIDGLFLGAYRDFKTTYRGGEYREWYSSVKDIYMTPRIKKNFNNWSEYITKIQYDNIKLWDFQKAKKELDANLTSSICVIWSVLNDSEFTDNYEIWFTGLDIERSELMKTGNPWKDTGHKDAGEAETRYLKSCINSGILNYLSDESPNINPS